VKMMADEGSTPGSIQTVPSVTTSRPAVNPTDPPIQTALGDPPYLKI